MLCVPIMMSVPSNASLESSPWFVGKMERISAEQFLMEVRMYVLVCVCLCVSRGECIN